MLLKGFLRFFEVYRRSIMKNEFPVKGVSFQAGVDEIREKKPFSQQEKNASKILFLKREITLDYIALVNFITALGMEISKFFPPLPRIVRSNLFV